MEKFLEIGKIVGTHGVLGELKVESWADSPEWLKKIKNLYFDKGNKNAGLVASRVHKNMLLVKLAEVKDVNTADLYRGKILYIDRNDVKLPKNRYFIQDLVGLKVYDGETQVFYGTIEDVFATGANNVYKIVNEGKEYLFPAVDHMIKSTDIEKGVIEILPIPGIFDGQEISDAL